jgi:ACS family hexuronate transporter-like MFS transporter
VDLWPAVFLLGLAAAAHQAWSANILTAPSDMFPKKVVASVTSIGTMGGYTAVSLFQLLTGAVIASFRTSGNVETGYFIMFIICAASYPIALFFFHLLVPKMEVAKL